MELFDNVTRTLKDDLRKTLLPGSRVSIAADTFSIYAFSRLKDELAGIDSLRFIFTSPSFLAEKEIRARREFHIPRLERERSLYGSPFEIRLRNELTQKSIARECADWIRGRARFRSNVARELMGGFITADRGEESATYMPVHGFTSADLGFERGRAAYNMVARLDAPQRRKTPCTAAPFMPGWDEETRMRSTSPGGTGIMASTGRPEVVVFAGPNGSGKSTLAVRRLDAGRPAAEDRSRVGIDGNLRGAMCLLLEMETAPACAGGRSRPWLSQHGGASCHWRRNHRMPPRTRMPLINGSPPGSGSAS